MDSQLQKVLNVTSRISAKIFGKSFHLRVERDNIHPEDGRIFIQWVYWDNCHKTGDFMEFRGGKWYLSDYMTDDEIVKKSFAAFRDTVTHEMMEGFKVDNIILFNPHTHFEELLAISDREVSRD